jgi:hypothetical protein
MSHDTSREKPPLGTIIESQLDWLTMSWDEGTKADRVEAWAYSRGQAEERLGALATPFRLMGYEGWTLGRVRFGRRDGDALLQLSGDLAEKYADTLVPEADRISRVDLAVTIRMPTYAPFIAEDHYAEAHNHHAEHPKSATPWLVQDADGGSTFYIGRRASDRFFRCYNKEAEQAAVKDERGVDHYAACWRYELECKGGQARPVAAAAVSAASRPAFVREQLHHYCELHGLRPLFASDDNGVLVPGFRRRSDTESRLGWLRKSVNPAILKMIAEVDRAEILDALGLGQEPS